MGPPMKRNPVPMTATVIVWEQRGFSILELLVVSAIIGILISLIAPAVLHSQEAARRVACENNLRQLGLALSSFESSQGTLPPVKFTEGVTAPPASMHLRLLPFLDQRKLFLKVNWSQDALGISDEPPISTANAELLSARISGFVCPSDRTAPPGANSYRVCTGSGAGLFQTMDVVPPNASLAGIATGAKRFSGVKDGLSNTICFAERIFGDHETGSFSPALDVILAVSGPQLMPNEALGTCANATSAVQHYSWSGGTWFYGGYAHTWYNHVAPPNSLVPDCVGAVVLDPQAAGVHTARSWHSGGVSAAFADSRVRFISNQIDLGVWRGMATVNGREPSSLSQ